MFKDSLALIPTSVQLFSEIVSLHGTEAWEQTPNASHFTEADFHVVTNNLGVTGMLLNENSRPSEGSECRKQNNKGANVKKVTC